MTQQMHATIHAILILLQTVAAADITKYVNFIPPKWAGLVMVIIAAVQGFVGWYNHNYNPDGTPSTTPYIAPKALLALLIVFSLVLTPSAFAQAVPQVGDNLVNSSTDCTTVSSCVTMTLLPIAATSIVVIVTSPVKLIADLRFEGSDDFGLSWFPVYASFSGAASAANDPIRSTRVNGAVTQGSWTVSAVGLTQFRVRNSQSILGSAGVSIRAIQ